VAAALDGAAAAQRLAGDLGAAVLVFVAGDDRPLLADGPTVGELDLAGAERHLAGPGGSGVSPEEVARFAAELRAAVRFLRSGGDLAAIATPAFLAVALDRPVSRTSAFSPENGEAAFPGDTPGPPGTRLLRVRRTLPRPRSEAPVLAAGWC
jgi:hypothetical protein